MRFLAVLTLSFLAAPAFAEASNSTIIGMVFVLTIVLGMFVLFALLVIGSSKEDKKNAGNEKSPAQQNEHASPDNQK